LALYKINSVQKQFLENFKQTLNRNLDKLPLLTPGSRLKFLWDAASVMARLYFCFVIPLDLGWKDKSFLFYDCKGISIFALLIIIFDLILSLNTAYYKDG
jgi:potassium voltage-gated channel Eag-related subfamily H protein 5